MGITMGRLYVVLWCFAALICLVLLIIATCVVVLH